MDLDGADWAVEIGPIASMNFRQEAIKFLSGTLEGFDDRGADKILASERSRVVEGLNEKTAEALAQRLGRQETAARSARGPAPQAGMAGAFRNGLPFIGIGLAPLLGLVVHPVGWGVGLALAAGLAWKNTRVRMKVLGTAPVGAITDERLDRLIEQYVDVRAKLGQESRDALSAVVTRSTEMLAASSDPDDVLALTVGSYDSLLADSATKMIERAVTLGHHVVSNGRSDFSAEEKTKLASLLDLGNRALQKARGEVVENLETHEQSASEEVEIDAMAELEQELQA